MITGLPNIPTGAEWKNDAHTIAGDRGCGTTLDRLHSPQGLWTSCIQNILIVDSLNHRAMKYDHIVRAVKRIFGQNIQGYGPNLLARPSTAIYHKISGSYIICDYHNRRVLQWFASSKKMPETIIGNIACFGLAVDEKGYIYVSDTERHEVGRYQLGSCNKSIVAGSNGQGRRLKQLNNPTYICIGNDRSLYISDSHNDRVVRWDRDSRKGVVVAGGKRKGKNLDQLDYPAGVLVDQLNTVYVADHNNHRVMRYPIGRKPQVIAGDHFLPGSDKKKLTSPEGLAFDKDGNLYVADCNNHRVQQFPLETH